LAKFEVLCLNLALPILRLPNSSFSGVNSFFDVGERTVLETTSFDPSKHDASLVQVLDQRTVTRCHATLPDVSKPVGAILYQNRIYTYVKFFADQAAAFRGANRMLHKGNTVVLTEVPKGLVLWVYEPEAQQANKVAIQ
jgi:hypothetical protein